MLKDIFSKIKDIASGATLDKPHKFTADEIGITYPLILANDSQSWPLAAYLDQLFEEDYASQLSDRWILPWNEIYRLMDSSEHANSISLLGLPAMATLKPYLASEGGLASDEFKVFINDWKDSESGRSVVFDRIGAFITHSDKTEMLPHASWQLLQAVRQLSKEQHENPGEATNQIGWANIRKIAKQTGAGMDGFLEKTIVLRPENLRLNPRKSNIESTPVIELQPEFDGQPDNWLESFDAMNKVQDSYRVPGADGTITHILLEPEIKSVLESVRALPGRRVAGDEALSIIRNPFNFLGDAAEKVLDQDGYEAELAEAGIYFHRFLVQPVLDGKGHDIESIFLVLEPISATPLPPITFEFKAAHEFSPFIHELKLKLAAGMPAGFWQGYELELSDFTQQQLVGLEAVLLRWQSETDGAEFDSVLDISMYGDRVIGIGIAEKITSPFLGKKTSEKWLSDEMLALGIDGEVFDQLEPLDQGRFEQFELLLDEALAAGDETVCLPDSDVRLPINDAKRLHKAWRKKIYPTDGESTANASEPERAVLQIEHNIEEPTYAQRRESLLRQGLDKKAELPQLLRDEVRLREHQLTGIAWLQHMFKLSPTNVAGCLLADDMGLGKTIQLLTFLVWYLEHYPKDKPVLIIAPVSLLDNWEMELERFFFTAALPFLKLYGSALSAVKFKKQEIPADLREKGIKNLLRPGWIGDAKIVLTTYETLRDQEFSLARQHWAIMICDEAQKLKNPAALITQAAKAIPARFRIACTGTPVENTLIDLWCLFDFIQPGFLGGLNQFGREYQRPIETGSDQDNVALERLRSLIDPQTLRRTKHEVAKDLPGKFEDKPCRSLSMHGLQKKLYLSAVSSYSQQKQVEQQLEQKSSGMLGLLHKLKLICAHPYCVQQDARLREHSPKLQWLIGRLNDIKSSGGGDKVIVFTELRDIQRELQHTIFENFGFRPVIINGDTSTNSQSAQSRQKLIDRFQRQPGFGVIILSTVAVGFGVNVQAANHVIHFTRCWNPAKEDQATDRAYRIGQEKDVFVYYPTVRDPDMPTFESTLDELLARRRTLARDMLSGSPDIQASDFEELLKAK